MRHLVSCPICPAENLNAGNTTFISYGNNSTYELTCGNGHGYIALIQNQQFELLFEMALQALDDGYYREAVMSAATSLESFFGYYVRLIWTHQGVPPEEAEATWKRIRLAERRIGLFLGLYVLENKASAPTLQQRIESPFNTIELRNEVTHNGYIPTEVEATSYCGFVYKYISDIERELPDHYSDSIARRFFDQQKQFLLCLNREKPEAERRPVQTTTDRTALEFLHYNGNSEPRPFSEAFSRSKEHQKDLARLSAVFAAPLSTEE